MKTVSKSEEYSIASRRITGTRAEQLAQIDAAKQELIDIIDLLLIAELILAFDHPFPVST